MDAGESQLSHCCSVAHPLIRNAPSIICIRSVIYLFAISPSLSLCPDMFAFPFTVATKGETLKPRQSPQYMFAEQRASRRRRAFVDSQC